MIEVFLCHTSKDKDFVRKLALDLENYSVKAWFDEWRIDVGDSLNKKIQKGIKESSYFAIVISPDSIKSGWVQRELNAAFSEELKRKDVFILPILYKDCEIPLFLQDKYYADFRKNYEDGLNSLLKRFKINNSKGTLRIKVQEYFGNWKKEDFTEEEITVLKKYLDPFLNKLNKNNDKLEQMYSIPQPETVSNKNFPYLVFEALEEKNLAKNNVLLSKSYYYYELLIDYEKKYSKYFCRFLKYLIQNEDLLIYKYLLENDLIKSLSKDLTEKEYAFILFLLDNFGFIELAAFGRYPPSNYDTFPFPKDALLKFKRITTIGRKFYREICKKNN